MKKFLFSMMMVALIAFSCSEKTPDPTLTLSKNGTIDVPSTASEQSITVTTNQKEYKAETKADWITISQSGNTLKLNIKENATVVARKAEVYISASLANEKIIINQAAANSSLLVTPNSIEAKKEAGTYTIEIKTNVPSWSFSSDARWIDASQAGNVLTVKVKENTNTEERNAEISIIAGKENATISVKQAAADVILDIDKQSIEAANVADAYTVNVNTNVFNYKAETDVKWIIISKIGNGLNIEVQENPNPTERTANIYVTAGATKKTITVKQAAGYFLNVTDQLEIFGDQDTHSLDVNSNTSWTVSCEEEWVKITKDGDNKIIIDVEENKLEENREAKIIVKYIKGTKEVKLIQKPSFSIYFPLLKPEATYDEINKFEEDRGNFLMSSNGSGKYEFYSWCGVFKDYRGLKYQITGGLVERIEHYSSRNPQEGKEFINSGKFDEILRTVGFTPKDDTAITETKEYIKDVKGKNGSIYELTAKVFPAYPAVLYTFKKK